MYNHVGNRTHRGTASSGYVSRNLAHRKRADDRLKPNYRDRAGDSFTLEEELNAELQDYEKERDIESQIATLRAELEKDDALTPLEVDKKVEAFSCELHESLKCQNQEWNKGSKRSRRHRADELATAFDIDKNSYLGDLTTYNRGRHPFRERLQTAFDAEHSELQKEQHKRRRMIKLWANEALIAQLRKEIYDEEYTKLMERKAARRAKRDEKLKHAKDFE